MKDIVGFIEKKENVKVPRAKFNCQYSDKGWYLNMEELHALL